MAFDIVTYMGSLTGFSFERSVLERIALERGVLEITNINQLTPKDRDLILADMLFVIYTSPSQSASISKSHGSFSQTIGSQIITDKDNIYELMMKLYKKWGEVPEELEDMENGLQWLQ